MNRFDLLAQFIGHRWAVCFVFRIDVVTEGFAFGIENDDNLRLGVILGQAFDHADHAFDGVGVQTFGVGQHRNRMKRTEQVRRPINENHRFCCLRHLVRP